MPFKRVKKPGKRDSSNENNNNEQIENHESIVEQVPNSAMSDWLSGGMNNNNNNEQFDQRDSEPKLDDHYAKTMKAAEKEVKEENREGEDVQLVENSLGSIALSCSILLSHGEKPTLRHAKGLKKAVNELEKIRKKSSFQRNRKEIEAILDKITAWLDQYGGNNDEVDEIRLEIARCNWALPGWEKWRDRFTGETTNITSLYVLSRLMEEIEEDDRVEAAISEFKEMSACDKVGEVCGVYRSIKGWLEKMEGKHLYHFLKFTKLYYDAINEEVTEFDDFVLTELIPFFRTHGNNKKAIEFCKRLVAIIPIALEETKFC